MNHTMYKETHVCYNYSPSCFCRASLLSRASCLLRSMRCCCSSVRDTGAGAGVEWINGSSEKLLSSNGSVSSCKRTSASSKDKINKNNGIPLHKTRCVRRNNYMLKLNVFLTTIISNKVLMGQGHVQSDSLETCLKENKVTR